MRGILAVSVLAAGFLACGPSKPAADPSTASSGGGDDSTKWDSSSETASHPTTPKSTPPPADDSSPPPSSGTGSSAPTQAAPTDDGPHLPPDFGGHSYDRDAAEVVLKRAARQVKANCGAATDDSGAANGPWGKTNVSVKLGHNGHSKSATIGEPYDGKPTGRCATQAFVNLQYPPFAGTDAVVDWEVEIVKPAKAK